ncbi:MAG TPA: FAD-binding oxidoreductase [Kribbellaceae bacterium]
MTTVLDDTISGQVLRPGDDGYDRARTVWNAMVDRRPGTIARCASTADVAAAVRFARDRGLELGVRCGGHSVLGLGVPEDGLMLDLTPMGAVRVDPARRRAWVQGGALLGALDRESLPHGLATTAGNVSHTGVGGLTLGGGMGWLARQFGLACDNVVSYEVVTAAGEVIRVSADEHPDLYWGLRGGGGNFGVVTEFEFQLHPVVTDALVVELYVGLDQAPALLRGWRDLSTDAPRQATFTAWVGSSGPAELEGRPAAYAGLVWAGTDPAGAEPLVRALRGLCRPVAERVEPMAYVDLQRMDDTVEGHAFRRYWKGHFLRELTDDAVDAFLLRGAPDGHGDPLPNASLQAYGGAIADLPDDATAFSHRAARFEFVTATRWTDPGEDAVRMAAARRYGDSLAPYGTGMYVNALSDEGAAGVRQAYPAHKLARLTALKDAYDPDNVFHLNHNIRPSGR